MTETRSADLPSDPTLEEVRAHLAPLIPANAAFDGWTPAALDATAATATVDPDIARVAFAGGAVAMIDAWFDSIDSRMAAVLPADRLTTMKIRERITALVEARLELLAPDREALRRALAILALPQNLPRATRLGWRAADVMWRLAGDTSVDYNHYTKRGILGGVYAATIAVFLDDDSPDHADTRAFLARRIDGIMRFEKAKAQFLSRGGDRPSLSRFIGRLRYPVR